MAALAARTPADPAEPLEILCTSGSTGNPKGVTVNQSMLLASTVRCLATIPAGGNRFVSILPLSHIMEQVAGLVYAVAAGAETEYITTLRPDVIAAAIKGHRATALVVVPQVLELLFNAIRREADRSGSGATFRRALRIAPYLPVSMRRQAVQEGPRGARRASCGWSCAPRRTCRPPSSAAGRPWGSRWSRATGPPRPGWSPPTSSGGRRPTASAG